MDLLGRLFDIARRRRRKIVLPEGDDPRIVEAAQRLREEKLAEPIVLGADDARNLCDRLNEIGDQGVHRCHARVPSSGRSSNSE